MDLLTPPLQPRRQWHRDLFMLPWGSSRYWYRGIFIRHIRSSRNWKRQSFTILDQVKADRGNHKNHPCRVKGSLTKCFIHAGSIVSVCVAARPVTAQYMRLWHHQQDLSSTCLCFRGERRLYRRRMGVKVIMTAERRVLLHNPFSLPLHCWGQLMFSVSVSLDIGVWELVVIHGLP